MTRTTTIAVLLSLSAGLLHAADIGIVPKKLIVVDKVTAVTKAKAVFVAKDAAVTKGVASDPERISVHFDVVYGDGSAAGAFVIPAGATNGWVVNKDTVAKYVNKAAPAGPTGAKVAVIKPAKLLKLVGKSLGDTPIDILDAGDPGAGGVQTAYCVTNGGEENCHCSAFTGCVYKSIAGGTGAKLVCKTGAPDALCSAVARGSLARPHDPVVLVGSALPAFLGLAPADLVAFRSSAGGAWVQIPIQVDERDVIDFTDVYNGVGSYGGNVLVEGYTDAGTFTGPDSDPTLDADDEIALMARDAGARAGVVPEPAGVVPGSGVEIEISDPVGGGTAYAYLFAQTGALDPGAGRRYGTYTFDLLSGDYKTTYGIGAGPNPEDSTVVTQYYRRHFSDRWIQDELAVFAGASTGVDVLDRHKSLFAPGVCGRSEDTFSNGEGAFVINKNGPVRGIRSYVGANSGPLTQREHVFYDRREDVTTFLRVHAISGIMDFYDYGPAASGMTYRNELNPGGFTIDGVPETPTAGPSTWELVTGAQGSITHVGVVDTTILLTNLTSYYLDDTTPAVTQCTGDAFAYGQSGLWLAQSIPNTDPRSPPFDLLSGTRTIYYDAPGLGAADAEQRRDWALAPLTATSTAWP